MSLQSVVLQRAPFRALVLAHRADVPMLLLLMLFHPNKSIAFVVADTTLKLDDTSMDALVRRNRAFACEQLVTEMAGVSFGEDMRHLLVLPELPGC